MEETKVEEEEVVYMIYRPVGCLFLDDCDPNVFWLSRKGAERDFPGMKIKQYSLNEFEKYLEEKKLEIKNVDFYD